MRTIGPCSLALAMMMLASGCMTGPSLIEQTDPYSNAKCGSSQWWAEKAMIPPGVKRKCKKGKVWPARPRPSGEGQQFSHTFHSALYWPLPYVCQDRQYVHDIMEVQRTNGWTEETTLYDRHFDSQEHVLTRPGELHLLRILEITPQQRRAVYIQSTRDPNVDSVRLANVEVAIAELTHGAVSVPITIRTGREYSRPASEVQIINSLYNASIPSPRLTGGAAAGGGGAGGAAATTTTP